MDSRSLIMIHMINGYIPCVCSGYNAPSGCLILWHYSPVMPRADYGPAKPFTSD